MAHDARLRIEPFHTAGRRLAALMATLVIGSAVAQSQYNSCWAWGSNSAGQLGDQSVVDRYDPTLIYPGMTIVGISAGNGHGLLVNPLGFVFAWGSNEFGQLGDGSTTDSLAPTLVAGVYPAKKVEAGGMHSLALLWNGTVKAWGINDGRLGDGTTTQRTSPVSVVGLTGVVDIAASETHSLALKSDGTVWGWGMNFRGELGDGTVQMRLTPVQAVGLTDVVAIAAGGQFSLALRSDGTVWAWGGNHVGQLGDGTTTDHRLPAPVPGLSTVTKIAAGQRHALAAQSPPMNGRVWAWGHNDRGQVGNGDTVPPALEVVSTPTQIADLMDVVAVTAGHDQSMALQGSGAVWSWGLNWNGRLGLGYTSWMHTSPQLIPALGGITAIDAGAAHTYALRNVTRPVTGTVTLGNFSGAVSTVPVSVSLHSTSQPFPEVEIAVIYANAQGVFTWKVSSPPGTYHLRMKASHWLGKRVMGIEIGESGVANVNLTLVNGDVNGDNSVNVADFLALRQAFGTSSGGGGFNPNADLNGDGSVNVTDFLILRANFGQSGV